MSDKGESPRVPENSENKNVVYYQKYCNEPDPNKRLQLTKYFIEKDAGDQWLYIYSLRSQNIQEIYSDRNEGIKNVAKQVEKEKEQGDINDCFASLVNCVKSKKSATSYQNLDSEVLKEFATIYNNEAVTSWMKFVKLLDVEVDTELLEWVKDLIAKDKIVVAELPAQKEILQSYIAYSAEANMLIICPDMITNRVTGAEIVLALSHERGHAIKGDAGLVPQKNDMVFDEFFAMMEEHRTYDLADSKFKNSIRNNGLYESRVGSNQMIVGDNLTNSNIAPTFRPDKITHIMLNAYTHALMQLNYSKNSRYIEDCLETGMEIDQIKEALKLENMPKESLLEYGSQNWRKIDDN